MESFTCPRCGTQSYSREDIELGYCWACDAVTEGEFPSLCLIPHLTVGEVRIVEALIAAGRADLEGKLRIARAEGTRASIRERLATIMSLQTAFAESRSGATDVRLYTPCHCCGRPFWPREPREPSSSTEAGPSTGS